MPELPTIVESAAELQAGRLTPMALVEGCLDRIRLLEPQVRAWVLVDEVGAREAARRLGDELRAGHRRGPLHGIPLGIKDIIDVVGWPTRAGSPLREGHVAQGDATITARLREAGAILLGKTVTTEFASFDPPLTRNPWNLERTPGGSSSGSAAAVALGMCLGAIGSQTGGSITRPASYCGVAGCKPTLGRVSLIGLVPFSFHLDHPGPMARTVGDLAAILAVIAGFDKTDPVSVDVPADDYLAACQAAAPFEDDGPRLGVLESYFMEVASPAIREAVRHALDALRADGTTVATARLPASFAEVHQHHRRIMAVEAAHVHRMIFPSRRAQFGPNIASLLDEGLATAAIDYAASLAHQQRFRREMLTALDGFDALVTPATADTAPDTSTTGDPKFNSPWSHAGLPTVSFPCGLAGGMPLALQLIGRPFGEGPLLRAAAWCEARLQFDACPPLLAAGT
ncbi:MAG TPA: amidase [Pirellulales bacterium]|nr:amidase [Pirellulales bacterium]